MKSVRSERFDRPLSRAGKAWGKVGACQGWLWLHWSVHGHIDVARVPLLCLTL